MKSRKLSFNNGGMFAILVKVLNIHINTGGL